MRILQLLGNTAFGGATNIVSQISQRLRASGHEVIIMANDEKTKMHFRNLGFICVDIKYMGRSINPYKDLRSVLALRRYVIENDIDMVHSHTTKGGIYSRVLKLINPSAKVVHTVHGYYLKMDRSLSDKMTLLIEKLLLNLADHTTYVNGYDFDLAKNWHGHNKSHLIYNGVDLDRFQVSERHIRVDLEKKYITIGISARIVHEKGYSEFVDLVKHYKGNDRVRFEILGDGPDEEHYKKLISEIYGVSCVDNQDQVVFHGYTHDVISILSNWDINILPSYREGLSISLLEAMAIGLPSVATEIRGNVEIIEDGVSGMLYEPRNSEALIKSVEILINDTELRKLISTNARKRVETYFDQEKMLEKYVALFESCNKN